MSETVETAEEMRKKLVTCKCWLILDTPLFMQRFSACGLQEINRLLSRINVENLSPTDVSELASFMHISIDHCLEEYCVLVDEEE